MSVPYEMLLHPELLSNEQLIFIMQERHLRISNIETMRREELLDIFHHYCVPYGQRKYRDSGRGRMLNKQRATSPETTKNVYTMPENNRKTMNPYCDRIKPPPDLLSGHMKRIKIDNVQTSVKTEIHLNNIKRKMSIDAITLATESPPPKKKRKPITWP